MYWIVAAIRVRVEIKIYKTHCNENSFVNRLHRNFLQLSRSVSKVFGFTLYRNCVTFIQRKPRGNF